MLSKLFAFRFFPIQKIDARVLRNLSINPLCTSTESPKIGAPNGAEDDEFVVPSLAKWLESHRLSETSESDADKISKILKENKYDSSKDAAIALDRHGLEHLSNATLERVLKRFDNDWVSSLGVFKWAESQKGYNHTPELYNSMVDILGKRKRFELMWELIEEMRNSSLEGLVSLQTMTKVMRRLVRARMCDEAIEAFRSLERFGVSKNVFALNALMEILTKENNVKLAEDVFLESKESIPPNVITFNVLIHGWCRAGEFEKARKRMEDMENHGFPPNVYTFNCFVEAHVRRKDYSSVRAVLSEMKGKGLKPSSVTRTIVIYGLGKAVQVDEALKTYERARKNGFSELDVGFFNSVIFVLGKAGRLREARRVFDDMTERGFAPNAKTYTSLISCACEHSMEETALTLLKKMEENGCGTSIEAYSALFKMFSKKRRVKTLRFLLDHMFRSDVSSSVGTYSILVTGLCKSGKLDEACGFFEEMVSEGMVLEESQFQRLRKKLEGENMVEAKEKIEKLMSLAKQRRC